MDDVAAWSSRALLSGGPTPVAVGAGSQELMYVLKLRARREVLGLQNPSEPPPMQPSGSRRPGAGDDQTASTQAEAATVAEEALGGGKAIMGVAAASDGSDSEDDDAEAQPAQPLGKTAGSSSVDVAAAEAAVNAVLTGAIAVVVARNAVKAAGGQLTARQRLLEVSARYSFPGAAIITQYLLQGLEDDFAQASFCTCLATHACCNGHACHLLWQSVMLIR